jgi:hypothetical protein
MAFQALAMLRSDWEDWEDWDVVEALRELGGVEMGVEVETRGEYVASYAALRESWWAFARAAMVERTLEGILIVDVVVMFFEAINLFVVVERLEEW